MFKLSTLRTEMSHLSCS